MTKIVSFVSGKGGVGKTCMALNFGVSLTILRRRVLLIDADLGMPNLGHYAGIEEKGPSLYDVLRKDMKMSPTAAVHRFQVKDGAVDIIPCGSSLRDFLSVDVTALQKVLEEMAPKYDYILLDTAPGLTKYSLVPLRFSDYAITIVTPDYASVSNAERLKLAFQVLKPSLITYLLINRVKKGKNRPTASDIRSKLGAEVLAEVPDDKEMEESVLRRIPLVLYKPKSKAARAILQGAQAFVAKTGLAPPHIDVKKIKMPEISKDFQVKKVF